MSRLTERVKCNLPMEVLKMLGIENIPTEGAELVKTDHLTCEETCRSHEIGCRECPINEAIEKLAHYEDLEEAGRLIELDDSLPAKDELDRCTRRNCNKCDKYRRELKRYKELEAEGRLIELPCKPSELVWEAHEKFPARQTMYCSNWHIVESMEAGYGIGYTKEEAEAKLAELKGGEQDA